MPRTVRPAGPLRVLFVVPKLTEGGAERHLVTLVSTMDRARFAPAVLAIGEHGRRFAEVVAAGVPARALGRTKRGMLLTLAQLVAELRRIRPDVVITRGYNAEVLGRLAAAVCRVPRSVVWLHNCTDIRPRGRLRRLFDRMLQPLTSAYFGVTAAQLPYLTNQLGCPAEKIRIIHNGVDLAQFPSEPEGLARPRDGALAASLGLAPEHAVAGIVAVLRPEKDHATLIRAAALVIEELPHARLLVVGGHGPLQPGLSALAGELGIRDKVIFTGARDDVHRLLPLMDVFVLSSRSDCCPMALLEAMAAGRPAVCTAVGGVPAIVDEGVTGHLVPPGDPAALAERLVALLGDRAHARRLGRAGRAKVEASYTLAGSVREAERAIELTAGRVGGGVAAQRGAR